MNAEQEDFRNYAVAQDRIDKLDAFDKRGIHAGNWDRMRAANKLRMHGPEDGCGWPGCDDRNVVKSHTIARSSGLGPIQQGQHVLMPTFGKLPVTMKRQGLKNATTFPGYCSTHEQQFQVFEGTGVLQSWSDVALQLFRSTAREYSNKRQQHAYLLAIHGELTDVLLTNPTTPAHPGLADEVLRPLENILERTKEEAQLLTLLWEACIELSESSDGANANPTPRMLGRMHVETSRRVALSGSTFIDAQVPGNSKKHRIPVVATMLPTETGVDLLFVTFRGAADQYETNLRKLVASDGGDTLVDHWLVAADWWCADPLWWESTELTWRNSILSQLGSL